MFLAWTLAACTAPLSTPRHGAPDSGDVRPPLGGNILIVVLDDVGADKLGGYGVQDDVPATPVIDGLAADGVTFAHVYANPMCSPSRALLQTGRRAWRTGIGTALGLDGAYLLEEEVTLPEMLDGYASSYVGKWHLASNEGDFLNHPNNQGWQYYAGSMAGIVEPGNIDGEVQTYVDWEKVVNGRASRSTTYMTTDTADEAIARLGAMPEPWLLVVSFHSPHAPYHTPPASLTPSPVVTGDTPEVRVFNRMLESVDTELGRVLQAVSGDTTVVVAGDNGTPPDRLGAGTAHGKGSLYEGGVRVPMIVTGPAVGQPGSVSHGIVEFTDVFATVAEIGGIDLATLDREIDGVSFLDQVRDADHPSARAMAFSEWFPQGTDAGLDPRMSVRSHDHRLVRYATHDELYDLGEAHTEGDDLLATGVLSGDRAAAYAELAAAIPAFWAEP